MLYLLYLLATRRGSLEPTEKPFDTLTQHFDLDFPPLSNIGQHFLYTLTISLVGACRGLSALHQDTVGGGLEPTIRQASSFTDPALKGNFPPSMATSSGNTAIHQ